MMNRQWRYDVMLCKSDFFCWLPKLDSNHVRLQHQFNFAIPLLVSLCCRATLRLRFIILRMCSGSPNPSSPHKKTIAIPFWVSLLLGGERGIRTLAPGNPDLTV